MELAMVFYLTNVTNAVNLSQTGVCIGGGLHAPIHISQHSVGLDRSIFQRLNNGIPRPVVKCAPESAKQRAGHKASYRIAKKENAKRSQ